MSEHDGYIAGLTLAHALVAHMLDCPGAKKTDIVSETPEYKIGYVEALINAMNAIDAKLKETKQQTTHHDHDHSSVPETPTQDQSYDEQPSEQATATEPPGQS